MQRSLRSLLGTALVALFLLACAACSGPAGAGHGGHELPLVEVSVAYLPQDALPARVLSGRLEDEFQPVRGSVIQQRQPQRGWWRVRVHAAVDPSDSPQLLLLPANLVSAEAWLPGSVRPVKHAARGTGTGNGLARALSIPLERGLEAGDSVYLRVDTPLAHPLRVRIDAQQQAHRAEVVHVAWRSAGLTGLVLLALLALGLWFGVRDPGFGLLSAALAAQCLYFGAVGGELRLLPWTGGFGDNGRMVHLSALLAVLASVVFASHYLRLQPPQRLALVLRACLVALGLLALAVLVSGGRWLIAGSSTVTAAMAMVVLLAALLQAWNGRRAALFLLVAWLPMTALLLAHLAELSGLWLGPVWLGYALPASCVLSGLLVMIGKGDTLRQLRRDRDRASHMATYDSLTGCLSRPAIETRLGEDVQAAHETGAALSVLFFDIDHFKHVNDHHGHLVGDQCLRVIALRARNRLRTYDLFGRWGGDEMLVVLPDTPLQEAVGMAENLRSAIDCRPLEIGGHALKASLSVGVAELARGETAEQLVRRADAALYASKQAGRNRVSISRWSSLVDGKGAGLSLAGAAAPAVDRSAR